MKSTKRDFLFFLSFGIYLFAKYMELSTLHEMLSWLPPMLKLIRYVSYAMIALVSVSLTRYTKKTFLRYVAFMLLLWLCPSKRIA